ncbi:MAG: hypothetical protein C4B59_16615 [Candidatus Methanogaster sp.]|uniref:Uncharacterized protein n=1 Tax=Candidatus Methanogaster sp. TaxID=3386292 RepID=A0AC61KYB7_9EURY|nr:MAG: hypothetical protein C4B59_16615 [ANME-2 cluster archaeon]
MTNRHLRACLLVLTVSAFLTPALADEIMVADADAIWNLTLDEFHYTNIGTDVMVVKYADAISYKSLVNATSIERLPPGEEPGVMVVRYADAIAYKPLENATEVERLVGEPDVIVVKYADVRREMEFVKGIYILNLTINSPENGDFIPTFTVVVRGTASSPNGVVNVTVNGELATGTEDWTITIPLTEGENMITVRVTDTTGYSITRTIRVIHYDAGCNYNDTDNDGVIDLLDQEEDTPPDSWVDRFGRAVMRGDVNGDGKLTSADALMILQAAAGSIEIR